MRDFNEFEVEGGFEDYHGFVYFDDEGLARSSADDEIVGVPVGITQEGDTTSITIQTHADDTSLPLWQRVKRWVGWG